MIIAFGGAPNAGVTVNAFKAAQILYEKTRQRVIFVSTDETVPTLGLLKPKEKTEKMPCLENLLENDVISRESIIRHLSVERNEPNFGILANKKAHPEGSVLVSKEMAQALWKGLVGISQWIVVDCGRCDTYLNRFLWEKADHRISIVSASLKSTILYRTANPEYNSNAVWLVALEKRDEKNLEKFKKRFYKEKAEKIGFCQQIQNQEKTGTLMKPLQQGQYKRNVKNAIKEVLL